MSAKFPLSDGKRLLELLSRLSSSSKEAVEARLILLAGVEAVI